MAEPFAALEEDFLRITADVVLCTVTTVDPRGRPRSRILHPIWQVLDGRPVGWVVTSKTPVKARHLATNPYVACSYWSPAQNVVYIDCVARWVEGAAAKQQVWDLFMTTPPPLGYDLSGFGPDGPRNPLFEPLRLDAWRVQVFRGEEFPYGNLVPRMWRAE
jgi:hypothetical protein